MMRIIGIDPGSSFTGWGIIEDRSGVLSLIDCGVIRPKSKGKENFAVRISFIYKALLEIIDYYKPEEAAIEQVFTAKNALTALKLGQARGVAVAACANFDIPIFDYVPTSVKKALVGVGRADKEQVAFMIGKILNVNVKRFRLDTTDALGVAVCHSSMRRFYSLTSK
ncbi:crossover junction endodeoxyribonuclease RuvC [Taurinivorans muris]|uniref:Crossover junction endodeoxyribonuclease RuvC n=1 Tax=Taurinivorans muris TaxID=2787751 RepID=A0ABY5Y3V7_9BACT|nr:crossover junction endodeoxyribonuclease RuvC [Desulfovibrionaceae bacterium LT0009]